MAIWTAFTLGLLGSFHCAAMCGPLAIAIPKHSKNHYLNIFEGLLYNFGRVSTYTLFGVISGIIGFQLDIHGLQNMLSYIVGGTIVLTSTLYIIKHSIRTHQRIKTPAFIERGIQVLFRSEKSYSKYMLGVLNGLLPCGFVYVAIAGSLVSGSIVHSLSYIFYFGLGTIPIMMTMFLAPTVLSLDLRRKMNTLIPVFSLVIGLFIISRALPVHAIHSLASEDNHTKEMCIYPPQVVESE